MKRIGLYGDPDEVSLASLARGARQLGYLTCWRNPSVFSADQRESFDFVVVPSLRGPFKLIRDTYNEHCFEGQVETPVLVVDLGYIKRDRYWQLGVNRLNWLPYDQMPCDRLTAMGVRLTEPQTRGEAVVLCGQVPGDASHGERTQDDLRTCYTTLLWSVMMSTARPVLWRPHPKAPDDNWGPSGQIMARAPEGLAETLASAWAVVTISSNMGTDALLAGVPVICNKADAPAYAEVAKDWQELSFIKVDELQPPSLEERQFYFNRLAYAQWTLDELASGLPLRFLLDRAYLPTERRQHPNGPDHLCRQR